MRIRLLTMSMLGLAVSASVYLARTQTTEPDHVPYTRYGRSFYLKDRSYLCDLVRSNVLSTPAWTVSEPLPLRPAKAVDIAREELRKLVPEESAWYVKEIALVCVGRTPPQPAYQTWYYRVQFEPTNPPPLTLTNTPRYSQSVEILIDFSGRPGVIKPL